MNQLFVARMVAVVLTATVISTAVNKYIVEPRVSKPRKSDGAVRPRRALRAAEVSNRVSRADDRRARAKRAICRRARVEAATLRTAERALDDAEVLDGEAVLELVEALQHYRVAYALVFVRAAPDASATVVGRRLQGDLVRATPAADNWVRVDGGFMMLEKPGLGRLLEPLTADEFEAASAAADARAAATRRETEVLVERACAAALATAAPGADEARSARKSGPTSCDGPPRPK